jgi:membrane-bound lytic murein transglycosylase F
MMRKIIKRNKVLRIGVPTVLMAAGAVATFHAGSFPADGFQDLSLDRVLAAGELRVIMGSSPHSYYVYRNESRGFDYELAREFADRVGVRLRVVPCRTWEEMLTALDRGQGDMIAAGIEITRTRARRVAFSDSYREVQPHLISNRRLAPITALHDLAGKTVDVGRGSAHHERMEELRSQGIDVAIRVHDNVVEDQLIQQVVRGEADFTVANSNVALMIRRYYPSAAVRPLSRDTIPLGWAVRHDARHLLGSINGFFRVMRQTGRLEDIYEKYHWNIGDYDYIDLKMFHERMRTRLPRYRPFIKDAALRNGFDWCLIAAQAYRESHLDPLARGASDAQGLLQVLPATGRSLKVTDLLDPVANIKAGVQYLRWIYDQFEGMDENDRLLTSLAAYNAGPGHIQDARRLASNMGLDPSRWESMVASLPLLRFRKYYQEAEHGYCRGDITVAYVKHIMIYYDILKRQELDTALAKMVSGPGGATVVD